MLVGRRWLIVPIRNIDHRMIRICLGTNSLGKLGGILGTETGLDGHGRVNEGDASVTR